MLYWREAAQALIIRGVELDFVEQETHRKCFEENLDGISQSLSKEMFLY
jgi:hypothetical protein